MLSTAAVSAEPGDLDNDGESQETQEANPQAYPEETPLNESQEEISEPNLEQETENTQEVLGFIILPHSDLSEIKGIPYDRISLLGACDPNYTLYVNGVETATTKSGYFSVYSSLSVGENFFTFENGGATADLTVIRKASEISQPKLPKYFEKPTYGIASNTIISRFYDRDDDNKPGTPLVKGTVFRVIAEDIAEDGFYRLYDGSYVFKSSVELLEKLEDAEENTLYSVELHEESLTVTFYRLNEIDENSEDNELTDEAPLTIDDNEFEFDTEEYEIHFKEGRTVTGYSVKIKDEKPVVKVKYALTDLSKARVLLDAGHGGTDPGALGPPGDAGLMEKDLNLIVARKTRDYLENEGVHVTFLRDKDEHVPILERMENLADSFDIAVSVHSNSMPMNKDFRSDEGPLMFYSVKESSERAASDIIRYISGQTGHVYTPAILRNFGITRYTAAPAMLFEMGYVCNPEEYERLKTEEYLSLLGEALGEGIIQYLSRTVQEDFAGEDEDEEEDNEDEDDEHDEDDNDANKSKNEITTEAPDFYSELTSYQIPVPQRGKSLKFTFGEIAFLGIITLGAVIRIVYELKK
ncbi:MAG: N-acetylmuramoyl-L-alanine amidase [Oscillospiraceae bacterium]|nr:N-acetylmuramoyl-L-alanine amidase [Oscillospiraceae bacterium]